MPWISLDLREKRRVLGAGPFSLCGQVSEMDDGPFFAVFTFVGYMTRGLLDV